MSRFSKQKSFLFLGTLPVVNEKFVIRYKSALLYLGMMGYSSEEYHRRPKDESSTGDCAHIALADDEFDEVGYCLSEVIATNILRSLPEPH